MLSYQEGFFIILIVRRYEVIKVGIVVGREGGEE
jgi:hypothetical protein